MVSIDAWVGGQLSSQLTPALSRAPQASSNRWPLSERRFAFIKIDTEGFDLKVLHGMAGVLRAGRVRVVQFEYNKRMWKLVPDYGHKPLAEAVALAESFGYEAYGQPNATREWRSLAANSAELAAIQSRNANANIVLIMKGDPIKKLVDHMLRSKWQ